jgi:hypothetical protein
MPNELVRQRVHFSQCTTSCASCAKLCFPRHLGVLCRLQEGCDKVRVYNYLPILHEVKREVSSGRPLALSGLSVPGSAYLRPEPNDLGTDGLGLAWRSTNPGNRNGPNQPQTTSAPVRAVLRCNRIQLDAMRNRANQPGFLFAGFSLAALLRSCPYRPLPFSTALRVPESHCFHLPRP